MNNRLLVIAGMPKCGTTALAHYLVTNGHASLLVAGLKEPYLFAEHDYVPPESVRPLSLHQGPRSWLLDASSGYATNLTALDRIHLFDPNVIVCFRNQFARAYSTYRMYKLAVLRDETKLADLKARFRIEGFDPVDPVLGMEQIPLIAYPRTARHVPAEYLALEGERLRSSTFVERIAYELNFFVSHRVWPLWSILAESFYTFPAKQLLARFKGHLTFVSLAKVSSDPMLRALFLATALTRPAESIDPTPALPITFSLKGVEVDEETPNFEAADFDRLRDAFRFDLASFRGILDKQGVDQRFLDLEELERSIA